MATTWHKSPLAQNFPTYLMIDSGSDLTWVQCEGCSPCSPINGAGSFKYTQSQTFGQLPCSHSLCTPKLCDERGFCRYNIVYCLGSGTKGMVVTDSFTFATNSGSTTAKYTGLAFGCGLVNQEISFGKGSNVIAGILGLGLGENSLLVQLQDQTKRRFSYCLPPLDRPTSLSFGDNANIAGPSSRIQETPLVRGLPRFFVLQVSGISVEQTLLNIDPEVFRLKQDLTGGFVVDSGSPYTYIVQSAYKILREEIVKYILEHNGLRPVQKPMGIFDVCYKMKPISAKSYVLPSVTFHFRGANLVMKPDVVFESFSSNIRCLAMLKIADPGPTLFGAFQQTNHRFVFDGARSMMSFAPEDCI